jgi:transglutaminase-like putative cysteine protease
VFVNRVPIGAPASIPDSLTGPSYLGDAPLLELKDPQMQALARQLTAADPARTAGRIGDWVNRNVGLDAPSPVRPGAGYTVRYRRGDPGTRALLFISLARAAGLPARLASGLVPSPNGFYFGSWPEVLLGDWVPVDLEAGRLPADPSRIRLMVGGAGRADELVPLLGAIRLQVLPPPLQAP